MQTAPQGDNAAALAAAQAKFEQVTQALDEVVTSIAKLKLEREELAKSKVELEAGQSICCSFCAIFIVVVVV